MTTSSLIILLIFGCFLCTVYSFEAYSAYPDIIFSTVKTDIRVVGSAFKQENAVYTVTLGDEFDCQVLNVTTSWIACTSSVMDIDNDMYMSLSIKETATDGSELVKPVPARLLVVVPRVAYVTPRNIVTTVGQHVRIVYNRPFKTDTPQKLVVVFRGQKIRVKEQGRNFILGEVESVGEPDGQLSITYGNNMPFILQKFTDDENLLFPVLVPGVNMLTSMSPNWIFSSQSLPLNITISGVAIQNNITAIKLRDTTNFIPCLIDSVEFNMIKCHINTIPSLKRHSLAVYQGDEILGFFDLDVLASPAPLSIFPSTCIESANCQITFMNFKWPTHVPFTICVPGSGGSNVDYEDIVDLHASDDLQQGFMYKFQTALAGFVEFRSYDDNQVLISFPLKVVEVVPTRPVLTHAFPATLHYGVDTKFYLYGYGYEKISANSKFILRNNQGESVSTPATMHTGIDGNYGVFNIPNECYILGACPMGDLTISITSSKDNKMVLFDATVKIDLHKSSGELLLFSVDYLYDEKIKYDVLDKVMNGFATFFQVDRTRFIGESIVAGNDGQFQVQIYILDSLTQTDSKRVATEFLRAMTNQTPVIIIPGYTIRTNPGTFGATSLQYCTIFREFRPDCSMERKTSPIANPSSRAQTFFIIIGVASVLALIGGAGVYVRQVMQKRKLDQEEGVFMQSALSSEQIPRSTDQIPRNSRSGQYVSLN